MKKRIYLISALFIILSLLTPVLVINIFEFKEWIIILITVILQIIIYKLFTVALDVFVNNDLKKSMMEHSIVMYLLYRKLLP